MRYCNTGDTALDKVIIMHVSSSSILQAIILFISLLTLTSCFNAKTETSSTTTTLTTDTEIVAETIEESENTEKPENSTNTENTKNTESPNNKLEGSEDGTDTGTTDETITNSQRYTWNLPEGFPQPIVPENNPMTEAKVELGRHLFYDKRLSGNGTQSCSTCHQQHLAFSDGLQTPIGSTGERLARNAPSLVNVAYNGTLGWANPELIHLQDQILIPMFTKSPPELGITDEDEILERFNSDGLYQQLFQNAYPDSENPITIRRMILAITSFTRTLISGNSPFDRYIFQGDTEALSAESIAGMQSFSTERTKCIVCHSGFNLTDATISQETIEDAEYIRSSFHNIGLYNLDGEGAYPKGTQGLFEFSEKSIDMGKFRAPSLRNVALTAPYFHDGSAETLEDVLDVYESGGRVIEEGEVAGDGRQSPVRSDFIHSIGDLTDGERQAILSFLGSLTDTEFINNPKFSNPFE